jgi:hypothetical protein
MKIMMSRIARETGADQSAANIAKCANEIHAFFVKNASIAQADLAAIFK